MAWAHVMMCLLFSVCAMIPALRGQAAAQTSFVKPLDDTRIHQGVTSCGGPQCHGSQSPVGTVVRQDEILTWQDPNSITGTHARAYKVLLSPLSKSIAQNLGIGPAHEAAECLSCHAHNVAVEQRGEDFRIDEGVTCEACHGGSSDWLTAHFAAGATHTDNIAKGLYPTDNVIARASLCLDCHFGSDRPDQFVTHRIMGAGHPRISFELDLFTAFQQHHDVDRDYLQRKTDAGGFKSWLVGQAMAMHRSATLFASNEVGTDGLFPELYFFDCHACHQTIAEDSTAAAGWQPNPSRPLGPGVPVYNDANLIMLRAAMAEISPEDEATLKTLGRRLHAATAQGRPQTQRAAAALAAFAADLATRLAGDQTMMGRGTSLAILQRILDRTLSREYTNYAAGEQAYMAIDAFVNAMASAGYVQASEFEAIQADLETAYAAVSSPNAYNPARFRAALTRIATTTRALL